MAPATRTQKPSTPASQTSTSLPIQKKKDLENNTKVAELEKIIEAQRLEIENLKKASKERAEKDAKKIEAAKKIIDNQKKHIIDQVIDRTGIEDIKAENERQKAEIAALKERNNARRVVPPGLAPIIELLPRIPGQQHRALAIRFQQNINDFLGALENEIE